MVSMKKEQIMEMLVSAVAVEVKAEGAKEPRSPYLLIPHNGDDVKFLELTKSQAEFFYWMQSECMIDECDYELLALDGSNTRWQKP